MKAYIIENINFKKYKKNNNFCSFDKLKNKYSKIKLSCHTSPQKQIIKNDPKPINENYHFNKRTKLNTKLNIITKSNLNINSIIYKPKLKKNKTHSKYNVNANTDTTNIGNVSHFKTSSCNNSNININKHGKKVALCVDNTKKTKNNNELNSSKLQNNNSQMTEHYNNINSYFETNNSSDNNKKHKDYFSLNKSKHKKKKYNDSINNSLNNTNSNQKGKNNNLIYFDKFQGENLFHDYQGNIKKKLMKKENKNNIYNKNNETYNKSINKHNNSYSNINFSLNNSINKIKTKSNTNILLNNNLTPYNSKNNKIRYISKPFLNNISKGKKPIIINNNNNSSIYNIESTLIKKNKNLKEITNNNNTQQKDKIDVQITSINNLLNNRFIKEVNNIQNEMERNIKLNQANSKSKKYNTIKHFFEKFLKKLNEYLNKNTFNCINLFLQKIINGYHEIFTSFSSENKNIHKLNSNLNKKIDDMQKMLKDSDKSITFLKNQNNELLNQLKTKKNTSQDNITYLSYNLYSEDSLEIKKEKNNEEEEEEQNYKVFKLNEKNLDDLDALYFFDKVNMKIKRSSSKGIPLIPIKDNNNECKIKENSKKKKSDLKNNYFLKIKQAFD